MSVKPPHRKLVKHYHEPGDFHELTFSCYGRLPLLTNNTWQSYLARAIDDAIQAQRFKLVAFVFMPEHVHLLVVPKLVGTKVDKLLFAIKRPFSYRVKTRLADQRDPLYERLTVHQRPGKKTFRFWQEGPGYDRNIRREEALQASIDYIHLNPVRRGLVEKATDYLWSSARWYATDGKSHDDRLPKLSAVPPNWFADPSEFTSY